MSVYIRLYIMQNIRVFILPNIVHSVKNCRTDSYVNSFYKFSSSMFFTLKFGLFVSAHALQRTGGLQSYHLA